MVERLFLAVPLGCLQFVIVVFPDHTHLLFLTARNYHTLAWQMFLDGKECFILSLNSEAITFKLRHYSSFKIAKF